MLKDICTMNWGLSLTENSNRATSVLFCVLSCVCSLIAFRSALWGQSILVPLDVPATLYTKYGWIDPALGKVPRNHYLIDMFDYDLPRTFLAHRTLHAGEFPWWDPCTDGGRPLASEAHMGFSDPIRLLMFRLFPFVTAYNWTRIIQSLLTGLGMFLLLRFLGFSQFGCILGALSFQFSGTQSVCFYPENVTGSLLYYPFLWLVLGKFAPGHRMLAVALGGVLCAFVLLAGNQQSHAYLVVFLACWTAGYGAISLRDFCSHGLLALSAFVLGCALAAPILIPQIELFMLSDRALSHGLAGKHLLTGVFSLLGLFPWVAGSFRSLDVGKLIDQQGASYAIHIGTPLMILAIVALLGGRKVIWGAQQGIRTALLLVLTYFVVICSTPIIKFLYFRSAGIGLLGLVVLACAGADILVGTSPHFARKLVKGCVLLLSCAVLITHIFGLMVYPRVKGRVTQLVLERDAQNKSMAAAPELRKFQVDNLPNDITFKNPEPLLAYLGALFVLQLAVATGRRRQLAAIMVLVLNVAPLLLFFFRFTPHSPIRQWNALLEGGPEQKRIMDTLSAHGRLTEQCSTRLDFAFPGVTACLYNVHTLLGYSSFPLKGPGQTDTPRVPNWVYTSELGATTGKLRLVQAENVRFMWANGENRAVRILNETPTSISFRVDPGPACQLIRTDTWYPGWRVAQPKGLGCHQNEDGFLTLDVPATGMDVLLRYRPSGFSITSTISVLSLIATGMVLIRSLFLKGPKLRLLRKNGHPVREYLLL
jgi:hypothetical protein